MTPEEKLNKFHTLCDKYARLTPIGLALIGMDFINQIDKLINDPDLAFMREFLVSYFEISR